MDRRKLLVTFFGCGLLRPAPGTWGSAGALVMSTFVLFFLVTQYNFTPFTRIVYSSILCVLAVLALAGGVWAGPWAIAEYGGNARKSKDPSEFVLDEAAGMWLSLVALPMTSWRTAAIVCGTQFLLFRVFDIVKPPPAKQLERLPAGWGIMMDDIAAGVLANVVGQIAFRILWPM